MTATAVLLSLEDVARELNITPLAAQRIVARGELPAAVTGAGVYGQQATGSSPGRLRLTPEALQEYVARGAPDVMMPPVTGNWFDDPALARSADKLTAALSQAAAGQLPDAGLLAKEWDTMRQKVGFWKMHDQGFGQDNTLKITPAMREVMDLPAPTPGPWRTWLQSAVVQWLRDEARQFLSQTLHMTAGLDALYATPTDYELRAGAAWRSLVSSDRMRVVVRRELGRDRPTLYYNLTTRELLGLKLESVEGRVGAVGLGALGEEYQRLAF